MKKIILTNAFILAVLLVQGQVITDTVSLGAGYANQVWYSLQNDEQGSSPKNNWDIAFEATGQDASILINSVIGTTLWLYPKADTSGWASVDTSGITNWVARYNSDTSWGLGAFNQPLTSDPYDLGWGVYNQTTHYVTGDSLYVIKLSNGAYKKIWIQQLSGGTYFFKYADLDGGNLQNATLTKTAYANKNFAYYSLQNNVALDREPLSASWDLLFTQNTAFVPTSYTVSGVFSNKSVTVAEVKGVSASSYNDWSVHSFLTPINEIGHDWKKYTNTWEIEDSLVYFVKVKNGDIWKLVFTGFGGSSNGSFIFSKEKLGSVGLYDDAQNRITSMTVFPNPVNSEEEGTLIYNIETTVSSAVMHISNLTGKKVHSAALNNQKGLHTSILPTTNLSPGLYFVTIEADDQITQQKLIIK